MKKTLLALFLFVCYANVFSQKDSLVFTNGNYMTGEIKSMNKGVLIIETAYSDTDFNIEWNQISFLFSTQNFHFTLVDGTRVIGQLNAEITNKELTVITDAGNVKVPLNKITEVKTFNTKFFDRVDGSIDFGYSLTKANNLSQLSLRSSVGYTARKWRSYMSYNSLHSSQDDVAQIKRTDGDLGTDYFLPNNWFLFTRYEFLQNDEMELRLRSVITGGLGQYFVKTNKMYWGVITGLAYNIEDYVPADANDRYSTEVLLGTVLNIFNVDDFRLSTVCAVYPSITEKNRVRTDFNIDLKYDLPLDFYIGFGYTLNYDSDPLEGASVSDYVFQTSIGWSL